jgi:type II secretory ATPase GspE/PulE/Tfp pilus assembly ATPase PilB-like protein
VAKPWSAVLPNNAIHLDHIDIDSLPLALINQHHWTIENFVPYRISDDHIDVLISDESHKNQARHALAFLKKNICFIPCQAHQFELWTEKLKLRLQYHQARSHPQNCDIIALCDNIIRDCIIRKASDIHIEPQQHTLRLRLRIDGIMHGIATLPRTISACLTARFKVISELDTTEKRLPQDSRFSFKYQQNCWDCRINICPCQFGEKIVIRLLNSKQKIQALDSLGIEHNNCRLSTSTLISPKALFWSQAPPEVGKLKPYTACCSILIKTASISRL